MARGIESGTIIASRYRLNRIIGQGGMATVWSATHTITGKPVALKLLQSSPEDSPLRKRFVREARAACAVHHPNVVTIHDILELEDGAAALVMDLLEGESLRGRLVRAAALSLGETADLLLPVISAVGRAHELGIVHRDLKPENIFLARGNDDRVTVKVLDFGIAKLTPMNPDAAATGALTETGAILGTPYYMSPEQVFGERDLDHRTDIWSLGVIAYECLTGRRPTQAENVGQVLKLITTGKLPSLRSRSAPLVAADVAELIDRMLARSRAERPSDLREVRRVFELYSDVVTPTFGGRSETSGGPAPRTESEVPTRTAQVLSEPRGLTAVEDVSLRRSRNRTFARRSLIVSLLGALGVAAAIGARGKALRPATSTSAADGSSSEATVPTSLADASAVLACPPLAVFGVSEPSAWLGAAAADLACGRVRWILGGRVERTRSPAELLDLPTGPSDAFPKDPFGAEDVRARAISAAQQRAAAYLEGDVRKERDSYVVELTLARADGRRVARAEGRASYLWAATANATDALAESGAIPRAGALDPDVARRTLLGDVRSALAWNDLMTDGSPDGLAAPCATLMTSDAVASARRAFARRLCLSSGVDAGAREPSAPLDRSSPFALALSVGAVAHELPQDELARLAGEVAAARLKEPSALGRAVIANEETIVLAVLGKREEARSVVVRALEDEPRDSELWLGLLDLPQDGPEPGALEAAVAAWRPYDALAWSALASTKVDDVEFSARMSRRAFELAPAEPRFGIQLGRALTRLGRLDDARAIASRYASGAENQRLAGALVLAGIDVSESLFGRALERLRAALSTYTAEEPWWFEDPTVMALELAELVGAEAATADEWAQKVLERALRCRAGTVCASYSMIAMCARASRPIAETCLARLDGLQSDALIGVDRAAWRDMLSGARRFVAGDMRGAAKGFRPLAHDAFVARMIPIRALEEGGAADLAEAVDAEIVKTEFRGASLAHPRMAARAAARGGTKQARELAERVIRAWSTADVPVPAVESMRALLARYR